MDGGDAGVVDVEDADPVAAGDPRAVGEPARAAAPPDLDAERRPDLRRRPVEPVHRTVGPVVEHDGPPVPGVDAPPRAHATWTCHAPTPLGAADLGCGPDARIVSRRDSIAAGTPLHMGVLASRRPPLHHNSASWTCPGRRARSS